MTPQVGKWYVTRSGETVKILAHDSWGYHGSNDEVYKINGRVGGRWEHEKDLDMDRGPIEPTTEELALYALRLLWTSFDDAGEGSFRWTPEEVSAVREALVKAARIAP